MDEKDSDGIGFVMRDSMISQNDDNSDSDDEEHKGFVNIFSIKKDRVSWNFENHKFRCYWTILILGAVIIGFIIGTLIGNDISQTKQPIPPNTMILQKETLTSHNNINISPSPTFRNIIDDTNDVHNGITTHKPFISITTHKPSVGITTRKPSIKKEIITKKPSLIIDKNKDVKNKNNDVEGTKSREINSKITNGNDIDGLMSSLNIEYEFTELHPNLKDYDMDGNILTSIDMEGTIVQKVYNGAYNFKFCESKYIGIIIYGIK